jgi:hypothetical protein
MDVTDILHFHVGVLFFSFLAVTNKTYFSVNFPSPSPQIGHAISGL